MTYTPIDMPGSPSSGDIYTAGNEVQYQYDGEKWVAYIIPGSAENYWLQNTTVGDEYLTPIKLGEAVKVRDAGGATQSTLKNDGGVDCKIVTATTVNGTGLVIATAKTAGTTTASINSSGLFTCENISMETFPALP